jgi:hypothetical protein
MVEAKGWDSTFNNELRRLGDYWVSSRRSGKWLHYDYDVIGIGLGTSIICYGGFLTTLVSENRLVPIPFGRIRERA